MARKSKKLQIGFGQVIKTYGGKKEKKIQKFLEDTTHKAYQGECFEQTWLQFVGRKKRHKVLAAAADMGLHSSWVVLLPTGKAYEVPARSLLFAPSFPGFLGRK
jgi:hypothetical protein